jgi:hypothetical protein
MCLNQFVVCGLIINRRGIDGDGEIVIKVYREVVWVGSGYLEIS